MANAREYKIEVPQAAVDELQQKLVLAKFPEAVQSDSWEYGVAVDEVERIAKYWQNDFSWAYFEERLNRLPHFEATINVDGFDAIQLHFLHQRSEDPDAIPLLFIHGCKYRLPSAQFSRQVFRSRATNNIITQGLEASWKPPRFSMILRVATRVVPVSTLWHHLFPTLASQAESPSRGLGYDNTLRFATS